MPPRRPASRSSPGEKNKITSFSDQDSNSPPRQDTNINFSANSTHAEIPFKESLTKTPSQIAEAMLGGDPHFADRFFGEPANMVQPLRPAPGEVSGDGSINSFGPAYANSHAGQQESGMTYDGLVLIQLEEDLAAYRYDLEFCRAILHPNNADNISAAETRTFQLRLIDLGHQMRMINHRIQLMQLTLNPGIMGRPGPATVNANTYMAVYPPGSVVQSQPAIANGTPGMGSGYYGQNAGPMPSSVAYQYPGYAQSEADRRRPGRPLGSRNRPRISTDVQQSSPAAASIQPQGPVNAAALATAGAKRGPPSEIHVATTQSGPPDSDLQDAKRIRLEIRELAASDAEKPTQNEITAAGNSVHKRDNDADATDEEIQFHNSSIHSPPPGAAPYTAPVLATPYGAGTAPNVPALNTTPNVPEAPVGDTYQRLGFWRCRLCTSQKYLNTPPPKQPSEPGTWPLRDVSKMVTHFTRLHGEHNNFERCMELGAALGQNRGPFRHWLTVTKKEKGLDHAAICAAVEQLDNGQMPAVLRKVSNSAANFAAD